MRLADNTPYGHRLPNRRRNESAFTRLFDWLAVPLNLGSSHPLRLTQYVRRPRDRPPVRDDPTGSYGVAQTGQCSGYDGESWQRPLGQIDVEWIVGQRFEWFDRFELVRKKRALAKVKVPYRLGTRRFRYARGRKPQGSADIWYEHHPRSVRSRAVGGVSVISRSHLVVARFHFGPSHCSVGSKLDGCQCG
jgi:hypothetical protein